MPDDPRTDLKLAMYAASKLEADRDVLLCGRSQYWNVKEQLQLVGLVDTEGGAHVLKILQDIAEASTFSRASILERIAPLVADASIRFTLIGLDPPGDDPGQAQAQASAALDP